MRWINDEVESRLLASILLSSDSWHIISAKFDPEVFAIDEYKRIAALIKDMADKGKEPSVTKIYVAARKQGLNTKEILNLDNPAFKSEIKDLNELLIDLHRKRLVLTKLKEAVYTIEKGDQNTAEVVAIAQDALLSAFANERKDVQDWQDVLEELYENQLLAQEGKLDDAIPLGLDVLDGIIKLIRGQQVIIAARPSMGKSALAMNIIKNVVKSGRRSLLFTPEQRSYEFACRSLSAELDIPVSLFGHRMDDHYLNKLNDGLSSVHQFPLRIVDKPKPSIDHIKTIARAEKSRYPDLDLIVVDYLGECDVQEHKYGGMQQATGRAVSELRGLAKELNVGSVVLSQLNRGLEARENKRPFLSDLRESGRIEEVADTIIFLYRHGYYFPNFRGTPDEPCTYADQITEVHCAKGRQSGSAGRRILTHFNNEFMRFETLEEKWVQIYKESIQ